MVVTVDRHGPSAPNAATAAERRARCLATVRAKHRHATLSRMCAQPIDHNVIDLRQSARQLQIEEMQFDRERQSVAGRVCNPGVALAIDCHTFAARAGLEYLDLARIAGRKARDGVGDRVGDPNPVLLIDRQVKRTVQLARPILVGRPCRSLAEEFGFARVALGQVHDPVIAEVECPDIAIGRDDDALHDAELAAEVVALGWRQRLSSLVEQRYGLPARAIHPHAVVRIDCGPESRTQQTPTRKPGGNRRKRMAIGGELRHVPIPQGILSLAADDKVGTAPGVALTIEHHLRSSSVPAAGEFERQDPRAGRKAQVRHERSRA